MFGLGLQELLIIGAIALLIFGPRQLPKLARSLGETVRETRKAGRELAESVESGLGLQDREKDDGA